MHGAKVKKMSGRLHAPAASTLREGNPVLIA
jgi:hypothetical protein